VQVISRSVVLRGCSIALCLAALSGCDLATTDAGPPEPGVVEATTQGPAGAPPGSCWGRTVSPAVIETVTEQVQVQPAQISATGEIQSLPIYRTDTRQKILAPRTDNWFQTPCADQMTPQFVSTLQRALEARGVYAGAISGQYDQPTRKAMRIYQISAGGPDSPILALTTARGLGLIAVDRKTLE
jgi:hypothetical protein